MTTSLLVGLGGCGTKCIRHICDSIRYEEKAMEIDSILISEDSFFDELYNVLLDIYAWLMRRIQFSGLDEIKVNQKYTRKHLVYHLKQYLLNDDTDVNETSEAISKKLSNSQNYNSNKYERYIPIPSNIILCLKSLTITFHQNILLHFKELIVNIKVQKDGQAAYSL